jgi:hypothetical protein
MLIMKEIDGEMKKLTSLREKVALDYSRAIKESGKNSFEAQEQKNLLKYYNSRIAEMREEQNNFREEPEEIEI